MTERSKGLFRRIWDKIVDKMGEQIATWLITFISLVVVPALVAWLTPARQWMASEWACIRKPWCEVQGWSLGVLIVATAATTVGAIYLGMRLYRTRRELHATRTEHATAVKAEPPSRPPFQPITVDDQQLDLRWFIRKPPREWLHWRDIASSVSPRYVHDTLDGPFHAAPGCNAPLEEIGARFGGGSSPTFSEQCPSCGHHIFRGCPSESGFGNSVNVWPVRAQALEELQRMERNGTALDGSPIVLERPAYWKVMTPMGPGRTRNRRP